MASADGTWNCTMNSPMGAQQLEGESKLGSFGTAELTGTRA